MTFGNESSGDLQEEGIWGLEQDVKFYKKNMKKQKFELEDSSDVLSTMQPGERVSGPWGLFVKKSKGAWEQHILDLKLDIYLTNQEIKRLSTIIKIHKMQRD